MFCKSLGSPLSHSLQEYLSVVHVTSVRMGLSQTTWSPQGHENPHIAAKCLPSPVLNGKKPQRGQQAGKGWRQSVPGQGPPGASRKASAYSAGAGEALRESHVVLTHKLLELALEGVSGLLEHSYEQL